MKPPKLSRQYRRRLKRDLDEDPLLAASWRAHEKVNAGIADGRLAVCLNRWLPKAYRLLTFIRHLRIERSLRDVRTLREALTLARKWTARGGKA